MEIQTENLATDNLTQENFDYQNEPHSHLFTLNFFQDIAVITINVVAKKQNWLRRDFVRYLPPLLQKLESKPVRGIIFISAKPDSFVQGFALSGLEQKNEIGRAHV